MIKILFMIHDLGPGGAEKVLVNLVNNLDRNKFDVTVISLCAGGINEQYLSSGIHYKTIFPRNIPGNSKLMKFLTPEQLHHLCVKEQYDIEISYLEGPSARIVSGCQNKSTKLISWIHVEQHTEEIAVKAFRNYREAVQCYHKFDNTVCVSESVKEDFQKIFPVIDNIRVLYNTNETSEILRKKAETVEDGNFLDEEFRICGVGKIMPVKGVDKLARIHKRLREEGYLVHTYILGTGSEMEKINKYIKENNLQESFTFLGYQTNPYKYVSRCDLFVCTSMAEGFSTAATEALIVGTPVITTPVAGMQEMLGSNNEYGVIVDFAEEALYKEIKRFIDCPDVLHHYKHQALLRGKDFSKEKTVKAVEDMLESIMR